MQNSARNVTECVFVCDRENCVWASATQKPSSLKWKRQKAREPGPGLTPSGGGCGAAAPQPLVVPPFMLVQGPLSVLCPRRNCPDHEPRAAGNSKAALAPANCSREEEAQECLPDRAPGSLTDWLRAAAAKPFTTRDRFHGRQRFHEWRGDGFVQEQDLRRWNLLPLTMEERLRLSNHFGWMWVSNSHLWL